MSADVVALGWALEGTRDAIKALNAELEATLADIRERTDKLNRLRAAIDALEGKGPAAALLPATLKPEPVTELVRAAAKGLEKEFGAGAVFDYDTLKAKCSEMFTAEQVSIVRRGIYTAVGALKKQGLMEITQGGHRLTAKGRS